MGNIFAVSDLSLYSRQCFCVKVAQVQRNLWIAHMVFYKSVSRQLNSLRFMIYIKTWKMSKLSELKLWCERAWNKVQNQPFFNSLGEKEWTINSTYNFCSTEGYWITQKYILSPFSLNSALTKRGKFLLQAFAVSPQLKSFYSEVFTFMERVVLYTICGILVLKYVHIWSHVHLKRSPWEVALLNLSMETILGESIMRPSKKNLVAMFVPYVLNLCCLYQRCIKNHESISKDGDYMKTHKDTL